MPGSTTRFGLTQALGLKQQPKGILMLVILLFLAYSAFCYWVIVMDGAEAIEGWRSFFIFNWFAAVLTPTELKFYVGISWLVSVVFVLMHFFSGQAG